MSVHGACFFIVSMRIDQIQCEVDRILSIAGDDSTVERIFIFGSACDPSRIHEESDLDLCIVQRTTLRFFDRLADWIDRIEPKVGLDLVVYTPEEFADLSHSNYFVREQIAAKGKQIYAA